MKKILSLIICLSCILTCAPHASAHKIGDVVGNAVYTDIIASINDYNIASFNINDYTAVVAEDLRNYGFNVEWVPSQRSLYITRGSTNKVASTYIAPKISDSQIGKKAQNIVYSDIKTYINGVEVKNCNIGGKTLVYFDDLSVFGKITYDNSKRRLDLEINDGLNYKISAPDAPSEYSPSGLYFKTNSADGLQVRWFAYNNTNKTIKYYTTTYYMFNRVGDFAYDSYGNNSFTLKTIGPVSPGERLLDFTGEYEGEVYDAPVHHIYLYSIHLEYSDGTSETIYYGHIGKEESGKFVL